MESSTNQGGKMALRNTVRIGGEKLAQANAPTSVAQDTARHVFEASEGRIDFRANAPDRNDPDSLAYIFWTAFHSARRLSA